LTEAEAEKPEVSDEQKETAQESSTEQKTEQQAARLRPLILA